MDTMMSITSTAIKNNAELNVVSLAHYKDHSTAWESFEINAQRNGLRLDPNFRLAITPTDEVRSPATT